MSRAHAPGTLARKLRDEADERAPRVVPDGSGRPGYVAIRRIITDENGREVTRHTPGAHRDSREWQQRMTLYGLHASTADPNGLLTRPASD